MTSDNHEKLIIRPKSNYDLSLPSGNSVSSFVMLRLYHLSQEQSFLDISIKIMESQAQIAAENPFGFGYLLNTLSLYLEKPIEITVINSENSELCKSLFTTYLPSSFIVTIQNSDQLAVSLNTLSLVENLLKKKLLFLFVKIFLARYHYIL